MNKVKRFLKSRALPLTLIWIGILVLAITVKTPSYRWERVHQPSELTFNSIHMLSQDEGWAVGEVSGFGGGGFISRWNGDNWDRVAAPAGEELYSVYMSSPNDGWAVGGGGLILRWDGANWSKITSPAIEDLNSVHGSTSSNVWIAGNHGEVWHWNGSTLINMNTPTDSNLNSIFALSYDEVWVAGEDGTILKWRDNEWTPAPSPTENDLNSVHIQSSNLGWAVGDDGVILRWNGTNWIQVGSPTSESLKSIYMLSPSEGWAVGDFATILYWDGQAWFSLGRGLTQFNSVYMNSSEDGWAVGGEVRRWRRVGKTTLPGFSFFGVWAVGLYFLTRDFFRKRPIGSTIPIVTIGLVTANIIVFKLVGSTLFIVLGYGFRPGMILHGQNLHSILTSMFLHADFDHLAGNMLFLLVFGSIIEERFSRAKFLLFYLLAGFAGSLVHMWFMPSSLIPAIGASGAIAGLLGACAFGLPHTRAPAPLLILLLTPLATFFLPSLVAPLMASLVIIIALRSIGKSLIAFPFLFAWAFYQFARGMTTLVGGLTGIAYWAHVGGFIGGGLIYHMLKKKEKAEEPKDEIPAIGRWLKIDEM